MNNLTIKENTDIDFIISNLLAKNDCMSGVIEYNSLPLALRKRLMYQRSINKV